MNNLLMELYIQCMLKTMILDLVLDLILILVILRINVLELMMDGTIFFVIIILQVRMFGMIMVVQLS